MNNIKNNFILENLHKKGIINESYEGDFLKNLKLLMSEWDKDRQNKDVYTKIISHLSTAKAGYGLVFIYKDRFENDLEKILLCMHKGEHRWAEYCYNSDSLVYFPESVFDSLCKSLYRASSESLINLHYVNSSAYEKCCKSAYGGLYDFGNTRWVQKGGKLFLEVLKNSRGGYIAYKVSSLGKEEVANFTNKVGLVKYLAKMKYFRSK